MQLFQQEFAKKNRELVGAVLHVVHTVAAFTCKCNLSMEQSSLFTLAFGGKREDYI